MWSCAIEWEILYDQVDIIYIIRRDNEQFFHPMLRFELQGHFPAAALKS